LAARDGADGQEFFQRAKRAEKRHRYLFGTPHEEKGVQKQMTELELLEELAHRRYASAKEQGNRLKQISQSELDRQSFVVMGLPPQELQRFNEAAAASESSPPSSPPSSSLSFVIGDAVMLHGLQAAAAHKYNGCLGCIEGGLSEGRYTVQVRDPSAPSDSERGTTMRVKPLNLRSVSRSAAEHRQPPLPAASRAPPSSAEESMSQAFAGLMNAAAAADLSPTRCTVLEARAAIKATTDEALNASQPCGDGDQSFVCEALPTDKGRPLKLARVAGMDFFDLLQSGALSPFAMTCFTGQLEQAQALVNIARSGSGRKLTALLEKRESMMRFTPLMYCISGANYPNSGGGAVSQHLALARMLLEAGALPNARDIAGFTAFHLATNATAANEIVLAIAAMLPQYGGDPNVRNRFGQVPLVEAVMSSRLDCIAALVEAGADPWLEDLSMRTLVDNAKKKKKKKETAQVVPTPYSLAVAQPAVLRLFSVASLSRTNPDASYRCSAPGCELPGPKVCPQCRRASYCGAACQKKEWKTHKLLCSMAAGQLTRVRIVYDTPHLLQLRKHASSSASDKKSAEPQESKPFRVDKPHTVKLQLPMTSDLRVDAILGYDRLRRRTFEIQASNNDPAVFQETVRAIRESGVSGGLKGYVNVWAANEHSREAGGSLDVDLRCMRPAQPW